MIFEFYVKLEIKFGCRIHVLTLCLNLSVNLHAALGFIVLLGFADLIKFIRESNNLYCRSDTWYNPGRILGSPRFQSMRLGFVMVHYFFTNIKVAPPSGQLSSFAMNLSLK